MKISNETKVGILTTIALALLFIGFNYLKGILPWDRDKTRFDIMKSVRSFLNYIEPNINLGIGKDNHARKLRPISSLEQ